MSAGDPSDGTGPARMVLVHGAWHGGSCWAPLIPELAGRGFRVDAPDLPSDVSGRGAQAYTDALLSAIDPVREPIVLVGHSLGGLTAPVAAERLGPGLVHTLVLLAAMTPVPGTSFLGRVAEDPAIMVPGYDRGVRRAENGATYWPPDVVTDGLYRGVAAEAAALSEQAVTAAVAGMRPQTWTVGKEITPLRAWPAVRTVAVVCAEDRVVAPDACRRAAAGIGAEVVDFPGGHFPMLTRPAELASVLAGVARSPTPAGADDGR